MKMNVTFAEMDRSFNPKFGEVYNVSDGSFEMGYTKGYEKGTADGYAQGHAAGVEHGYKNGYSDGVSSGYSIEDELLAKTIVEYRNPRPVTIGNRFFSYCYNLTTVDIPNAVSIKEYAFVYCTALRKIVLPSTPEIMHFAFQNCTALTTVDLHAAERLQSNVLSNTNLTTLILRRSDKITENGSTAAFANTPLAKGAGFVYVPRALMTQYKTANNWSACVSQIRVLEDYTVDGTITGELDLSKI